MLAIVGGGTRLVLAVRRDTGRLDHTGFGRPCPVQAEHSDPGRHDERDDAPNGTVPVLERTPQSGFTPNQMLNPIRTPIRKADTGIAGAASLPPSLRPQAAW